MTTAQNNAKTARKTKILFDALIEEEKIPSEKMQRRARERLIPFDFDPEVTLVPTAAPNPLRFAYRIALSEVPEVEVEKVNRFLKKDESDVVTVKL